MNYEELTKKELPFDGAFFLARKKKYRELIFFVHFYEGNKKQLLRHIKLVNSFGFDAFAFNLSGSHKDYLSLNVLKSPASFKLPFNPNGTFGMKHAYAIQIETLLNLIPGPKIMYTFSNPSASAIEAMAKRNCSDTVAMICDSGPTARFTPSAQKLFAQKYEIKPYILSYVLGPLLGLAWSPILHKDLVPDLNTFPDGFQILSIRGWKDLLIPPTHIDEVFEPHSQLAWSKLSLPEAGHLTGLRDFKDDYASAVEKFLGRVATEL